MPSLFEYKARDHSGALVTGRLRGDNPDAVRDHLEDLELIPVRIKQKREEPALAQLFQRRRARLEDLILITRKLATLYRAGVPVLRSLDIVAEQYQGDPIGRTISAVRQSVERGDSLSDALQKHAGTFPPVFVASIRAAEVSGKLDTVLDRLSEALERELVTREEIKKAIRYPLVVIGALILAGLILMTVVVPKFVGFYRDYGAELPLPTQILIAISDALKNTWYVIFPSLALAGWGLIRLWRHPRLAPVIDRLALRFPVIGNLATMVYFSRFSHLLATLIASGASILKSLDVVKGTIGNTIIAKEIDNFAKGLREGRSLLENRHLMPHFPRLVISLLQIGLESGSLEMTLKEVSGFFDREVHYSSRRLIAFLEPVLVAIVGMMILFMALAIFLPMWNLISVFGS